MHKVHSRAPSAAISGRRFRNTLALGTSVLAAIAASAPAQAQEQATQGTPAAEAESTIVVTGVRASLDAAMDIKRESSGVVDAISAEDIGKFPSTNLAESLQRVPGVSIDRRNGEGSQVTVRGFGPTFNLVTVNGRQLAISDVNAVGGDQDVDFSRATSRSFDFGNLAPEGVSRLEVYKTGRAAVPSGGIGATINVVTQRPLDGPADGLRGSIGAKAVWDTSVEIEDLTPEVSGLVAWSDPDDTFGVSLFGAYQDRNSAAASSTSNNWDITRYPVISGGDAGTVVNNPPPAGTLVAVPRDSRYHYSESSRERINGQLTLQFRPIDTLTLTGDAFYAQQKIDEARSDQGNWFNRPFDIVTFNDNPLVAAGIFEEENLGTGNVKDIGFEQQYRATKTEIESYGLNAEWEIADGFTLNLDGNHSKSRTNPNSANGASSTLVSFGAPVVTEHSVDWSGEIPQQDWTLNDAVRGNGNGVLDIGDLGTQVQRTNVSSQAQRINQLRADLEWEFGDGGSFNIGALYIDSKMTSARVQTQQTLGDWGINNVGDVQEFAGDLVSQFCMQCQFDRYHPTDADIAFRGNAVDLYQVFADAYSGNPNNVTGNDFDQVREKIWAGYAQLTWDGEMMGRPAGLVAGVRFENTKVHSFARFNQPDYFEWDSDNDFTRVLRLVPETLVEREGDGEYTNLLPSIDFRLEPMDDLVARVSYSKTLARPDYGNLFASAAANGPGASTAFGGSFTGTTGNPGLKPLVSDNFDVSLEWYFAQSSYVSAGFFYKKVKNFVGTGTFDTELFGLRDPSSGAPGTRSGTALAEIDRLGAVRSDVNLFTLTALLVENGGNLATASGLFQSNLNASGQVNQAFADTVLGRTDVIADANDPEAVFSVSQPVNTETANFHGFELQAQYFFGDTGFGVLGSYTMVSGDVDVDVGADPGVNVFALTGLSDTFSVTGIYDKNGISARLSYNWRDKFLSGINRGGNNRNPVFNEPFGTLDASINYDLTEQVVVSLEAINILGEPIRTYGRDPANLFFAQELSPRILAGARYRF